MIRGLSSPITQLWASSSIPPTNPSFLSLFFLSILLLWTQKDSGASNAIVWESYVRVIKAYTVCVLYNPAGFFFWSSLHFIMVCNINRPIRGVSFVNYDMERLEYSGVHKFPHQGPLLVPDLGGHSQKNTTWSPVGSPPVGTGIWVLIGGSTW